MVAAELALEDDSGVGDASVALTEMVGARLALDDEALVTEPIPPLQPALSATHANRMRNVGSSVGLNAPVTAELLSGRAPTLTPGDQKQRVGDRSEHGSVRDFTRAPVPTHELCARHRLHRACSASAERHSSLCGSLIDAVSSPSAP